MAVENKNDVKALNGEAQSLGGELGALRRERAQMAELEGRVQERTQELQRANEALRELSSRLSLANDRLRMSMESGKSVGWDRDVRTGRDILFGDLQSVFGMPLQTYVGSVEDFRRRVHPDDRARVVKAVDDAMGSRMQYEAEFRVVLPDGAVRWLSAKGKFYYSPRGEPERMVGMAVDITERKLMEVALRESEQRLRLAVQAGKMYAIDWDVATDVVIRSDEATHIHGLASEASNKMTHRQVLAREDAADDRDGGGRHGTQTGGE